MLIDSGRLNDFKRNPQMFIEHAAQAINGCKRRVLVDGVKYQRVGDDSYYAQELFNQEEITGYMKHMLDAKKSIYDKVIYESETERTFAEDMERNLAVKVYAKLPGWFKVPTPLGSYNPDWAVLVDSESGEKLYFVLETKGSTAPPTSAAASWGRSSAAGSISRRLKSGSLLPATKSLPAWTICCPVFEPD